MLLQRVTGALLLILATISIAVASTDRPIIGIWTESSDRLPPPCNGACEMIAASYVKWVESAGGRAVAVPYNATIAQVQSLKVHLTVLL
jgi:gamma-glutamyl hydrolase